MLLPLVIAPDHRLEICSAAVEEVTDDIRTLMDNMLETMYHEEGIGLSAVQIGIHKRVLVMDLQKEDTKEPIYMVNPEILESSEEQSIYKEGCLSFPEQRSDVIRPKTVKVRYLDYYGKPQEMFCDGLLATCVQHEIDNLNGIVFIDHISALKRDMILRKMHKAKKRKQ